MIGIDRYLMSSKPFYPSEESDSRILRGYCGARELMIRPTLYQGLGPVPRRVFAEDEWGKAEMPGAQPRMTLSSALQDFKGKSNISLKAAPKKPPEEEAGRIGPTWGYGAELV